MSRVILGPPLLGKCAWAGLRQAEPPDGGNPWLLALANGWDLGQARRPAGHFSCGNLTIGHKCIDTFFGQLGPICIHAVSLFVAAHFVGLAVGAEIAEAGQFRADADCASPYQIPDRAKRSSPRILSVVLLHAFVFRVRFSLRSWHCAS